MKYLSEATRGEDILTVRAYIRELSVNGTPFQKYMIALINGKVHFCFPSTMSAAHWPKTPKLNALLETWIKQQPENSGLKVQILELRINNTIVEKETV